MKEAKKLAPPKWAVTLVWLLGILAAWEIGAFIIQNTKRSPENVLPHIWQILGSIVDPKKVSNNMTTIQIVLDSARDTLLRAAVGFALGSAVGFLLALIMKLSGIVEKILFPNLMIIQMIQILGMAPIILSIK